MLERHVPSLASRARGVSVAVAVRAFPKSLERAIVAALPAWCVAESQNFALAVHALEPCDGAAALVGLVERGDEYQHTRFAGAFVLRQIFTRGAL